MADPTITYSRRQDASQEAEISALAGVYRLIIDSAKKEGSRPGAPDDAKGPKHDRATQKYTRT